MKGGERLVRKRQLGDRPETMVEIVGVRKGHLSDVYYALLQARWSVVLVGLGCSFLLGNALFALAYLGIGGIEGARPGSFADAFFFSVQTMATIGYGGMQPVTTASHLLVTAEAMTGILGVALTTGLLFAKFSRPTARVLFSRSFILTPRDGIPSLVFRVGNERTNHIVQAEVHVTMLRSEITKEGEPVRRLHKVELLRNQNPTFVLTWTVIHQIGPHSPLHGLSREEIERDDVQLVVTLIGHDATLAQTIHARHTYRPGDAVFGGRFVDVIGPGTGGRRRIDYGKFHDVVPHEGAPAVTTPAPKSGERTEEGAGE